MAAVTFYRQQEWMNRRFPYRIFIDNKNVFDLYPGEQKTITLDQSASVKAKLMWGGSSQLLIQGHQQKIMERGNRLMNIILPMGAFATLVSVSVLNLLFVSATFKMLTTGVMVIVMIGAILQVTLWRNRFIDIEPAER